MQKVEGSSPFIRFEGKARSSGVFCFQGGNDQEFVATKW